MNCENLEELFRSWQKEQEEEIDEIGRYINEKLGASCIGEMFVKEYYKKKERKNTISSQFVPFFNKLDCLHCSRNKGELSSSDEAWKYVLKNAFNMDGCVGTLEVKSGFEYIFLLKEANDSKKSCIEDYPKFEEIIKCGMNDDKYANANVNRWILDWMNNNVNAVMLEKIRKAFSVFYEEDISKEKLFELSAYMNINKRGGTFVTLGYDENAVINYANRYKEYILREIQLLSKEKKEVHVFVCGGKKYFEKLMDAIEIKKNELNRYELQFEKTRITFVSIPHPSGRVTIDTLAKRMKVNGTG